MVIPFVGSEAELEDLRRRLAGLRLRSGDSIIVVDNRPRPAASSIPPQSTVRVLSAPERQSSYYARNRGVEQGESEWIVFIDADTEPCADLLDRYLDPLPGPRTAILAGAIVAKAPATEGRRGAAERWAHRRRHIRQEAVLNRGGWAYAQTANCAVRRSSFEAAGGFVESVRSGGDAELCFRLKRAGWEIERRDAAVVVHRGRSSVLKLLSQVARHGAGAAWLERMHPGSSPPERPIELLAQSWGHLTAVLRRLAARDLDFAVIRFVDLLVLWALALGRLVPNEVGPKTPAGLRRSSTLDPVGPLGSSPDGESRGGS